MHLIRWAVAGFFLLNAVYGSVLAFRAMGRRLAGRVPSDVRQLPPEAVFSRMPWRLMTLWIAAMALFVASAALLVLERPEALLTYIAALLLDLRVVRVVQSSLRGISLETRDRIASRLLFGLLFTGGGSVVARGEATS
jgi:hypothetical protein